MEQRFGTNRIDLEVLREFCEREGEAVVYHKGDQLEREGERLRVGELARESRHVGLPMWRVVASSM